MTCQLDAPASERLRDRWRYRFIMTRVLYTARITDLFTITQGALDMADPSNTKDLTLMMTSAPVVETSVNVITNNPCTGGLH